MRRAHSFFSHTASKTRFFSSDSASIFFNSLFSRSSSLSRRASLISICPNCRFHRWKLTSEMFSSRQMSWMLFSPRSAARRMRILSSVAYRLPFIVWSFHLRPRLTHHPARKNEVTSPQSHSPCGLREEKCTKGIASTVPERRDTASPDRLDHHRNRCRDSPDRKTV